MLEALIPYIEAPERTLLENVPIIHELKLQVFGPLVMVGVILGWHQSLKYAKFRDIDEDLFRDYLFWMLVSAFVISHWVSVIFYFPHQIEQNPWVLLEVWNGLSSVGGFFGAFIGMFVYLRLHKQPLMVYADATVFGLLLGWCFGRLGCSLVHDHPGKEVEPGTFMAVGPWPDGSWRYDLGLLEFCFAIVLMLTIYFVLNWRTKRPGWLTGLVVLAYAPFRFGMDFLRAEKAARGVIGTPDARYAGLTPAQWFTIAFFLAGVWLVFLRKSKPTDFDYAKDSERRLKERAEQEGKTPAEVKDDDARTGVLATDEPAPEPEPDSADRPPA